LDLLLDLIRKQEINIYDIPIAKITQQYLDYMQHAVELNVELSSEFVYMAATLILIKSKMLLPRDPELVEAAQVSLFDLVKVFQNVLDRVKSKPVYEIGKDDVSVPDMIQMVGEIFRKKRDAVVSATELFESQPSRRAMICLFLAVLELVKSQAIMLTQSEMFGDIGVKAAEGFDEAFRSKEAITAIEQEYN
jgi:segregation and condensation protein A